VSTEAVKLRNIQFTEKPFSGTPTITRGETDGWTDICGKADISNIVNFRCEKAKDAKNGNACSIVPTAC
jgi:hypothetical protein